MKRWQPVLFAVVAVLLVASGLILAEAGSDRRATLKSTHARLTELRMQRLAPQDSEEMKRALTAGPDPQLGVLIATEAEAASRLETFIRSTAHDHEAEIQSISFTTGSTDSTLPTVRGNLRLTVDDANIGALIKALEIGPPAAFLESFRIASRPSIERDAEAPVIELIASILVYRGMPMDGKATP